MRRISFIGYIMVAVVAIAIWPSLFARADDVSVDADVGLSLSGDSTSYTLKSGSGFKQMNFDASPFDFTGGGSASIDLRSSSKKSLNNSRNIPMVCGDSESSLLIPATNGNTTVTPSDTCGGDGGSSGGGSGGSGGSGGGGGGGGGGGFDSSLVPAPTTVDKVALLKQQIANVQATIQQKLAQAGGVVGSAVSLLARNLGIGDRNDGVKTLQQLLARDKDIYPEGLASGFFGPATTHAVQKFQMKYGLIKSVKDSGSGQVGPKTRAKINELFGAVSASAPQTSAPSVPAPAVPVVPQAPVAPGAVVSTESIRDAIQALQAKLIQAQIKAIQDKINALKK